MFQNILLPVDLNQESSWQKALPTAVEYCNAFGATLHVMNVVPDFGSALVGSYFPEGFEKKSLEALADRIGSSVERIRSDKWLTKARQAHLKKYKEKV